MFQNSSYYSNLVKKYPSNITSYIKKISVHDCESIENFWRLIELKFEDCNIFDTPVLKQNQNKQMF